MKFLRFPGTCLFVCLLLFIIDFRFKKVYNQRSISEGSVVFEKITVDSSLTVYDFDYSRKLCLCRVR